MVVPKAMIMSSAAPASMYYDNLRSDIDKLTKSFNLAMTQLHTQSTEINKQSKILSGISSSPSIPSASSITSGVSSDLVTLQKELSERDDKIQDLEAKLKLQSDTAAKEILKTQEAERDLEAVNVKLQQKEGEKNELQKKLDK